MKYLIIILILTGCSSQWHLRRAIKKDPLIVQVDTLSIIDTVTFTTETIRTDSTFFISKDTVIIIKDKLTIKHFIQNDSVYIWGECEGDTIVKILERDVIIDRWIYPKKKWTEYLPPTWILVCAFIYLAWRRWFRKDNHQADDQD